MLKKILQCPNCKSRLRSWYQLGVTRITCPKCWAEIPVEDPRKERTEADMESEEAPSLLSYDGF